VEGTETGPSQPTGLLERDGATDAKRVPAAKVVQRTNRSGTCSGAIPSKEESFNILNYYKNPRQQRISTLKILRGPTGCKRSGLFRDRRAILL